MFQNRTTGMASAVLLSLLCACDKTRIQPAPVPAAVPLVGKSTQAAVSRGAPAVTPAATPDETLMAAALGKAYRPATKDALATLADEDDPELMQEHIVTPIGTHVLATGETVLLARVVNANDLKLGEPDASLSTWLSVYFMRQKAGKWSVLKRFEKVSPFGGNGRLEHISWIALGPGKSGMAVLDKAAVKGCSSESLALFEVSGSTLRTVARIETESSSKGMCFPEHPNDFWSVRGTWQFAASKVASSGFNDILFVFDGQRASPPEDERNQRIGPRVTAKINGKARYAYDPAIKFYRLVEGKNVVPVPEMDG